MNKLYNIMDQQLLSLLNAWNEIHAQFMHDCLAIPSDAYDRQDEGEEVPEIICADRDTALLDGIERAARILVSAAEDAGLIRLDDWSVINAILCNIGSESADNAAQSWWRGYDPYNLLEDYPL